MSLSFDSSLVCPVLIGREPQLAALDRLIERVGAGQGQAALLAGEAGVGKSRLVAEVKVRAANQGFAVLQGRCFAPELTRMLGMLERERLAGIGGLLAGPPVREIYEVGVLVDLTSAGVAHIRGI